MVGIIPRPALNHPGYSALHPKQVQTRPAQSRSCSSDARSRQQQSLQLTEGGRPGDDLDREQEPASVFGQELYSYQQRLTNSAPDRSEELDVTLDFRRQTLVNKRIHAIHCLHRRPGDAPITPSGSFPDLGGNRRSCPWEMGLSMKHDAAPEPGPSSDNALCL